MQLSNVFVAFFSATAGLAIDEIDYSDVPWQCHDVCKTMAEATHICNNQDHLEKDGAQFRCVYNYADAVTAFPACLKCAHQDRDGDEDIWDYIRGCDLSGGSDQSRQSSASQTWSQPQSTLAPVSPSAATWILTVTTIHTNQQNSQTDTVTTPTRTLIVVTTSSTARPTTMSDSGGAVPIGGWLGVGVGLVLIGPDLLF